MRGWAIAGAAAIATAAAAAPAAAPMPAAEQAAALDAAQRLVLDHRAADALPGLRSLRARIEAGLAGETRTITSGQTREAVLADMLAAAATGRSAVDVGPVYGRTLFLEGFALVELDRLGEARAALDRAAAVSPSDPQVQCEDAHTHARDRDAAGALAIYERCDRAAALAPPSERPRWHAAALRGRGFALTELGRLDEADAAYGQSLAVEPDNPTALRELDYIRGLRGGAPTSASTSTRSQAAAPAP